MTLDKFFDNKYLLNYGHIIVYKQEPFMLMKDVECDGYYFRSLITGMPFDDTPLPSRVDREIFMRHVARDLCQLEDFTFKETDG